MKTVAIFGATSAIAMETSKLLASEGARFFLVARSDERLKEVAADLKVRGANHVEWRTVDLSNENEHSSLVQAMFSSYPSYDFVLIAYGILGDQKKAEEDVTSAFEIFKINFLSSISLLTHLANRFERQKSGTIAVISSVAGDRGRQSNYVYGASKGGLDVFLEGLRNRLFKSKVHILTVKPGFVSTPMTAHLKQGPLFAKPEIVANGILKAADSKKNIVYLPRFWSLIMLIIRSIPEAIFKRLKL